MSRKWIEYSEPAPVGREELYVSLRPEGRMTFSEKTYKAVGEPAQVVLLWDPEGDAIGVRPASRNAVNAFTLQRAGRHGARLISCGRFLRKHDLRLDHTVRFPMAHVEDGILILDLHTRVPAVKGRARKR